MILSKSSFLKITLALFIAVPVFLMSQVHAADFTNRRLEIGSSEVSANTIYTVEFDIITAANLGSIAFEFCDNSPLDLVVCNPPSGMDVSGAIIDSQSGEVGFTVHANTTANRLVLTRVPIPSVPQPVQYVFSNIINADTVGSQYLRVYTYNTDDGTGAHTDRGGYAYSLVEQVNVAAYVPPILQFCVAKVIISSDCSSFAGSQLDFGTLNENTTSSDTLQMAIGTNAVGGYTLTISGTTMTSGNNVIPRLSTQTASLQGVSQFGMNLAANTIPVVGASPSGVGTGQATNDYNDPNLFKFNNGDVIAFSPLSTEFNKYTASFIVNVDDDQPAGYYSTTITIIALATF